MVIIEMYPQNKYELVSPFWLQKLGIEYPCPWFVQGGGCCCKGDFIFPMVLTPECSFLVVWSKGIVVIEAHGPLLPGRSSSGGGLLES